MAADVIVGVPSVNPDTGETFEIDINVDMGAGVLGSYLLNFEYDPAVVNVLSIAGGSSPQFSTPPTTDTGTFISGVTPLAAAQSDTFAPTGFVHVAIVSLVAVGSPTMSSGLSVTVVSLNDAGTKPMATNVFGSGVVISFDPLLDADVDGLTNLEELNAGTDPGLADTDGDGLLDGFEVSQGLDPFDDGSTNATQGSTGDPDGDGLTNAQEQTLGTNPNLQDTDSDGLTDDAEVVLTTSPTNADTDLDGLPDGYEVTNILDPLDNGSTNVNNGGFGDPDLDTLTNAQEFIAGTDPNSADTDLDGLSDNFEVTNGLDPLDDGTLDFDQGANGDPDQDGLINSAEFTAATNATLFDTDADGLSDGFEVTNSLDALDDGSIDVNNGGAGDPDNDGHTNLKEFQIGSLPQDLHSQPVTVDIPLVVGMQPLFYPLNAQSGFSAFDVISILDTTGTGFVSEVQGVINGADVLKAFNVGSPTGTDFSLGSGVGVIAVVDFPGSISFVGPVQCPAIDLNAGVNVTGLRCFPPGYTAFQWLVAIGDDTVIANIQKFNLTTGRYDTAAYSTGIPVGTEFGIRLGEAYIVNMKLDVLGFDPLL